MDFVKQLFSSAGYSPHGFCYLWNPGMVWLHVVSDSLIALAYFAIPISLLWIVRKRRDLPFSWMFVLFGVFIIACGTTHLMEVWDIWHANYWLAGAVKAVTAAASVPTAILLAQVMPKALELPTLGQWIHANALLEKEVRERRDVELDLRVSEANYRDQADLLDLTHDAIIVRNLRNEIIYWNRGAERMYGWMREEVKGKIKHEILHTVFPKPLAEIEVEVLENGSWEGELTHRRRDGSELVISSRWNLRKDTNGQPLSILEINRDITQSSRVEKRFRNLLESAPDAMVIFNSQGKIQIVNAQTENLFGYSREELLDQPVEILVPQRFHDSLATHRNDHSETPRLRSMGAGLDLYGRRKDGTEFPVEISLSPLDTGGEILTSSAIRDVTARHHIDDRIRKLNADLNQKVGELSAANKELESFSYSVSHDLRAPLRHIDGFTRILKEEHAAKLSEEGRSYLDRVIGAAIHMGKLVDDMLNLARVGRRETVRQKISLNRVIQKSLADLPQDKEEGREIEWRIGPLPDVQCDPGLLQIALTNLLSNALKFTRKCTPAVIEVGTKQINGTTAIFVRDNGVGFDLKYADKLFGVFQRLHRQEDFEGTGVGLATVQRIIHKHGGEIWAEAQVGQGATFYFTLPVLDSSENTHVHHSASKQGGAIRLS